LETKARLENTEDARPAPAGRDTKINFQAQAVSKLSQNDKANANASQIIEIRAKEYLITYC
jgi:hypothetical protein